MTKEQMIQAIEDLAAASGESSDLVCKMMTGLLSITAGAAHTDRLWNLFVYLKPWLDAELLEAKAELAKLEAQEAGCG